MGDRRLSDPLRAPGFLTRHQFRAVKEKGNFFLVACPGSGKTRTGGVRFARLMEDGKRAAATSYTNVGAEQIRAVVSGALGLPIRPSCFVGTLHLFLLRYVFYPFGHMVMGCTSRPRVVHDDSQMWDDVVFGDNKIRKPASNFSFTPEGSVCYRRSPPRGVASQEDAERLGADQALRIKERAAARGMASADDAMFWSLRVLQEHPELATSVALRFEELLIDEAQDTSQLQLACIAEICKTGRLGSLALIGDLEQSIYSFQGASPEGCADLADQQGLERIELTENHRSSQKICDVVVHLCGRDEPDRAVGPNADCQSDPELVLYPRDRPSEVLSWFGDRLHVLGIDPERSSILARTNDLVDEINTAMKIEVKPRLRTLGRAVSTIRSGGTLTRHRAEAVDRILAMVTWGIDDLSSLEAGERRRLREASGLMLEGLPLLEGDLRAWARMTAQVVGTTSRELVTDPAKKAGQLIRAEAVYEGVGAEHAFRRSHPGLRAQTVHDLKGESRAAVLVVAGRGGGRRTPQVQLWSMSLTGAAVPAEEAEEIRVAFVALTRAERFCALALPDNTAPEIVQAFLDHGFRSRDSHEKA